MQFLMLIKIANDDYEAGMRPPPELDAAMGELIGGVQAAVRQHDLAMAATSA